MNDFSVALARRAAIIRMDAAFRLSVRRIRHAVRIEPSLQALSPENGNIPNIRRRLSAIWVPQRPISEPGDREPIRKSPLLAGISEVIEGRVSRRRTGWLE